MGPRLRAMEVVLANAAWEADQDRS